MITAESLAGSVQCVWIIHKAALFGRLCLWDAIRPGDVRETELTNSSAVPGQAEHRCGLDIG